VIHVASSPSGDALELLLIHERLEKRESSLLNLWLTDVRLAAGFSTEVPVRGASAAARRAHVRARLRYKPLYGSISGGLPSADTVGR